MDDVDTMVSDMNGKCWSSSAHSRQEIKPLQTHLVTFSHIRSSRFSIEFEWRNGICWRQSFSPGSVFRGRLRESQELMQDLINDSELE
jgi:hypothetical protein